MLQYIFQVVLFQLLFLLIYDAFLKRETFFNYNRLYLLLTSVLALALPFVQIEIFKSSIPEDFIIRLPEVVIGNLTETSTLAAQNINTTAAVTETSPWSWSIFIYIGMLVAALVFAFKLIKIYWLLHRNPSRWQGDILLVLLLNSKAAFSFFHYVFLGEKISTTERQSIIKHELVHVQQKHSLDLLYFEVLRVLFWFNPLIYMYQNRLIALHEYLADAEAVKNQDKNGYYQNLLAQVFDTTQISFINPFYKQSLIKKRIVMLSKSKSKQLQLLKYALLIPMVAGMLMYTSSYAQETKSTTTTQNHKMSDEDEIDRYYQELKELEAKGVMQFEISSAFMGRSDEYILSRDDFYKEVAFMKYIMEVVKKRDDSLSKIDKNHKPIPFHMERNYKDYETYLNWKSSNEAREKWEELRGNRSLMVIVEDLKNLTDEERSEILKKLKDVKNGTYWKILVVRNSDNTLNYKLTSDNYTFLGKVIQDEILSKELESLSESNKEHTEIPFAVVERVPAFKGCENLPTNQQTKECTSLEITKFVNKNFDTSIATKAGLKGRQRINVLFKIDTNGNIVEVKARAPHPALETEAKRVVEQLPQMTPGKQKGKNITVQYSLPIIFQISE